MLSVAAKRRFHVAAVMLVDRPDCDWVGWILLIFGVFVCRMEPAGRHALRDAAGPPRPGQVQTASAGDAGEKMAGPMSGGTQRSS